LSERCACGAGGRDRHRAWWKHQLHHWSRHFRSDPRHGAKVCESGQSQSRISDSFGRNDVPLLGLDGGGRFDSQRIKGCDREQARHLRFRAFNGRRDRNQMQRIWQQRDQAHVIWRDDLRVVPLFYGRDRARPPEDDRAFIDANSSLAQRMLFQLHFGRFAKFSLCFALITLFTSRTGNAASQKRNITEKDLWDFVWIGDPQISPDGSRVAFVRVTVNEKKEAYNTSIWSVPVAGGEEPHQL